MSCVKNNLASYQSIYAITSALQLLQQGCQMYGTRAKTSPLADSIRPAGWTFKEKEKEKVINDMSEVHNKMQFLNRPQGC